MSLAAALDTGLEALDLQLTGELCERLLAYLALVEKWNRVYNLTAVRERERMVSAHLLDSLAVVPHLDGATLIDVGSGAGLPGIPIALARPHWQVVLLESNHKKAAFLRQAAIDLALANVEVAHARAEAWSGAYDVVISRAFSDLSEFVALAGHLVAANGVLAAMKGVHPFEEIAQLPASHRVRRTLALEVPGLDADRHLVFVERA